MSKKASASTIGAFIIGALAVGVAAAAFLASGTLFGRTSTLVSYFSEPVNGLSVGAPVKYRGIQLGQVTRIGLERAEEGNDYAEVHFTLDHARLEALGADAGGFTSENWARLVRRGLRSRLEVESIVTGVVFVTLEFKEDAGSPRFVNPESDAVEVPTTASPMSELTESAGQVIARLSKIDVNGISDNLLRLAETLNEKLEDVDVGELQDNLTASSDRLHDILSDPELGRLPRRLDEAIAEFKETNELLRDLIEGMERPVTRLDTIALHLQTTMDALEATSESARDMLAEDAEFRQSLESALSETAKTMKSLRRLTDMLERNPRAMLSGKPEDRK